VSQHYISILYFSVTHALVWLIWTQASYLTYATKFLDCHVTYYVSNDSTKWPLASTIYELSLTIVELKQAYKIKCSLSKKNIYIYIQSISIVRSKLKKLNIIDQ
jgi:hypothetical protein